MFRDFLFQAKEDFAVKSVTSFLLKTVARCGIIKENITIGRSLGTAGKNYPVKLPDGNHAKFAEGTEIIKTKVFAGKGTTNRFVTLFSSKMIMAFLLAKGKGLTCPMK